MFTPKGVYVGPRASAWTRTSIGEICLSRYRPESLGSSGSLRLLQCQRVLLNFLELSRWHICTLGPSSNMGHGTGT